MPFRSSQRRHFGGRGLLNLLIIVTVACGMLGRPAFAWRETGVGNTGNQDDPVYDKSVKGGDKVAEQAAASFEPMQLKPFRSYARAKNFHRLGLGSIEAMFHRFDADSSGGLDETELSECKRVTAETLAEIEAAKDPEKMMSFEQFVQLFEEDGEYENQAWMEEHFIPDGGWAFLFNRLDVDDDYYLDDKEQVHLNSFLGTHYDEDVRYAVKNDLNYVGGSCNAN